MKQAGLFLILLAKMVSGCSVDPHIAAAPLVLENAVVEDVHRAVTKHVHAQPGTRLDDFERTIEQAEHETAVDYLSPEGTNGVWQFRYDGKKAIYYGRFIREEPPPLENSPAFSPNDILNPAAMAAELKSSSDPVSSWLFSRFNERDRTALTDAATSKQHLKEIIAHELTAVVYGPPIYDEGRFHGVSFRSQTERVLEFRPKFQLSPGALAMFHAGLNRLLLEDAYPQQLAQKQKVPPTHHYIAVSY